jgi:O-antigen biosynthesis protein WbqP
MYLKYMKRPLDFLLSLLALVLFWGLFLLIIILIKATSKGPLFFKQKRIGINKREFYIIKFRTMRIDTPKDVPTHMLQNPDQYITGIGKLLRLTSLDELPQLINILKGEMSIVGPRPALWNQQDLIDEREKYGANSILPGLTGWAQVNGRDELPIPVKAKLDGEYIEKMSLIFDVKCLIRTVGCVFFRKGFKEGTSEVEKKYGIS